ncbi:Aste57867_23796 [Aphanomyces stellatus]|uniref:Aste57867_23796 protein n=1 Tax=Aphanomyces stellatus TaxID=120398 RepID=A0A485LNK8_9STRA|nr:hypothetical protein As57867_023723 [Aphanomyces stellatus]VFU00441.1 Aste57867_23796 [Aphanomyces stellatus]
MAYAKSINVLLERIPPRFTWVCQPADVAWNRPLKARLRQNWLDMIRRQLRTSKLRGIPFKLQPPSRATIVEWIASTWADLPTTIVTNGFKKCQLIDGSPTDEDVAIDVVDEDVLANLVATCSIEETIDPGMDIDYEDTYDDVGSDDVE